MRPPIDLPPANTAALRIALRPATIAASTVASSHLCGSGRLPPRSVYGNWKRRVAMPRSCSSSAMPVMNAWSIPAPAPWART